MFKRIGHQIANHCVATFGSPKSSTQTDDEAGSELNKFKKGHFPLNKSNPTIPAPKTYKYDPTRKQQMAPYRRYQRHSDTIQPAISRRAQWVKPPLPTRKDSAITIRNRNERCIESATNCVLFFWEFISFFLVSPLVAYFNVCSLDVYETIPLIVCRNSACDDWIKKIYKEIHSVFCSWNAAFLSYTRWHPLMRQSYQIASHLVCLLDHHFINLHKSSLAFPKMIAIGHFFNRVVTCAREKNNDPL